MTKEQIEFIKNHFFKNEEYAGWGSIAQKLLEDGKCIVAGNSKLWYGGVGNFIKCTSAEGAIGCSLLTFDKDSFLQSVWFKEQADYHITALGHQIVALSDQRYAIERLVTKK
jgi:hypothetical protein